MFRRQKKKKNNLLLSNNNNNNNNNKHHNQLLVVMVLFIIITSLFLITTTIGNINNNNIVLANSLTNNKVLYIDNSGKLATSEIEENSLNKLNKIDTIESNITTIQQQLDSKQGTVTGSDGITVNSNNNITINKSELLNMIYPVGSIYISVNNVSPATFLGGSWSAINDGYYLRASANGGGDTLGEQLPNIKSTLNMGVRAYLHLGTNGSTALYPSGQAGGYTGEYNESGFRYLNFDANRSNSIYTDNGVVRPKSIKVYMWKRTS